MVRRSASVAAVVCAVVVAAGCGGGDARTTSATPAGTSSPVATVRAATDGSDQRRPAPDGSPELVWIKRVAAVPDPIADDLRIQASGRATFRKGYAGLGRGTAVETLPRAELRRFQRLVARARPASLPVPDANPTRGGYAYTIRARGGTGAANSGHLPARVSPLLRAADRLISRLADHLDFRSLHR